MTSAGEHQAWVEGYEVPIKQALWQRILTCGVPRTWAACWTCCCLYVGLLTMMGLGFTWLLIPALVWMLGHGALMGLTLFDPYWDDMALAQLTRRYKAYYDAG
jgi:type IV secretory pathway TrbD component